MEAIEKREVYVAGGFGNYLNIEKAILLGIDSRYTGGEIYLHGEYVHYRCIPMPNVRRN